MSPSFKKSLKETIRVVHSVMLSFRDSEGVPDDIERAISTRIEKSKTDDGLDRSDLSQTSNELFEVMHDLLPQFKRDSMQTLKAYFRPSFWTRYWAPGLTALVCTSPLVHAKHESCLLS